MRFGMIAFCRFSKVAVPTSAKNGRGVREQLEIVFSLGFLCIQRVKKHRFLENHHFKFDPVTSYFLKKIRKKRDKSIVTWRKNKEKNKKKNKNVHAIKTNRISFDQNDGFSTLDLARGECEKNGSRSWRMAIYDEPRWS